MDIQPNRSQQADFPPSVRTGFPTVADFFGMLAEQSANAAETTRLLVEFMETGDVAISQKVRDDEHEADRIKAANLSVLSDAFSTPVDREDLFRAITTLDDIVNYCKSTVVEMDMLGLQPDKHSLEMATAHPRRAGSAGRGFGRLASDPAGCRRRCQRRAESRTHGRKSVSPRDRRTLPGRRLPEHVQAPRDLSPPVECGRPRFRCRRALDNIVVKLC
jgi:hypothetical protein